MEWFGLASLGTVVGATAAVTLITAVLKSIVPAMSGRRTQTAALVVAVVIVGITNIPTTPGAILLAVLNACVIFAAAVGLDQVANYRR